MRTALLMVAGLLALAVTAPAQAATRTVRITSTGFSPATVTVATTDTVRWFNADTRNHQVVANNGSFASPILRPGRSYSFTFRAAGTYRYHDGLFPSRTGTVRVTGPPPAVTAALSKPIITYGESITLSGAISSGRANERVTIYARPFPQASFAEVTTVLTTTGGAWGYIAKPTVLTSYEVRWRGVASATITVQVRPKISLAGSRGLFYTRVSAAKSFHGRWVYVQRRSRFGQWVSIRKLTLGPRSGKFFRLQLPLGTTRLRIFLGVNQAGGGYLDSASPMLTYRRR